MAAVMFMFGVVGNMGGGVLEIAAMNWLPMFENHSMMMVTQLLIGCGFTAIYFFTFKYLILRFDIKTPGRNAKEDEIKLFSKAEYRNRRNDQSNGVESTDDPRDLQALQLLEALGGMDNIEEINNCATRLRISVRDPSLLMTDSVFCQSGAHAVVRNKDAIQIVIGLSVSQVRDRMEKLMESPVAVTA
ncbi:glucose PTS transporter subunit EIIB [Vibrio diazotrophicus]